MGLRPHNPSKRTTFSQTARIVVAALLSAVCAFIVISDLNRLGGGVGGGGGNNLLMGRSHEDAAHLPIQSPKTATDAAIENQQQQQGGEDWRASSSSAQQRKEFLALASLSSEEGVGVGVRTPSLAPSGGTSSPEEESSKRRSSESPPSLPPQPLSSTPPSAASGQKRSLAADNDYTAHYASSFAAAAEGLTVDGPSDPPASRRAYVHPPPVNILATDVPKDMAFAPFPQWRLLSNRYSTDTPSQGFPSQGPPVFTTRADAVGSANHCADALRAEALGYGPANNKNSSKPSGEAYPYGSCEWNSAVLVPCTDASATLLFAHGVRANVLRDVGLDLDNLTAVAKALACAGTSVGKALESRASTGVAEEVSVDESCAKHFTAVQQRNLRELLAMTYLPPQVTTPLATTTADGDTVDSKNFAAGFNAAAAFVAAVTTPFIVSVPEEPDYMEMLRLVPQLQPVASATYHTEAAHYRAVEKAKLAAQSGRKAKELSPSEENDSANPEAMLASHMAKIPPPLAATPSPAAIARLSPSSPFLATLLGNDVMHYHGDGLPRASALLTAAPSIIPQHVNRSRFLSNVFTPGAARFGAVEDPQRYYSNTDAAGAYEGLRAALLPTDEEAAAINTGDPVNSIAAVDAIRHRLVEQQRSTDRLFAYELFHKHRHQIYSSSQLAVGMTDRLVRLSPSATRQFRGVLEEGVRSVVGADLSDSAAPLPGVLHRSGLRSSVDDAASGNWNMSDLPPWLRIPSFVNPADCLDPPNVKGLSSGDGAAERFQPGDDAYEAPRSVLFFGPSHSRNQFSSLCTQYTHGARRNAMLRGGRSTLPMANLSALCETLAKDKNNIRIITRSQVFGEGHSSSTSSSSPSSYKPIPVAFAWSGFSPFRVVEHMGNALLDALAAEEAKAKGQPSAATRYHCSISDESLLRRVHAIARSATNDVVQAMTYQLPLFTTDVVGGDAGSKQVHTGRNTTAARGSGQVGGESDGDVTDDNKLFSYSEFMLWHRRKDFAPLRGLFTHVVFSSGVWEAVFKDTSIAEHTEDAALTLDLIEEIFAPEKIIIYNPHRWWPAVYHDTTGDATREAFAAHDTCNAPHSLAKYRDAHLCAAHSPTRARVRRSWAEEFAALQRQANANAKGANNSEGNAAFINPSASSLYGKTAVEVFDPFSATSQPIAGMFLDGAGHHYGQVVQDGLVQRILRDHVCPPRYVLAVRPAGEGDVDAEVAAGGLHEDRPPVNFAASSLPWRFSFPPGVDRVVIPVLTARDSADRMPSLSLSSSASSDGSDEAKQHSPVPQLRDLFPLFKAPIPVVSEGLCRAIFDHPYAAVNSHTRAVRINASHGLQAYGGMGGGAKPQTSREAAREWWRSVAFGFSPVDKSVPAPAHDAAPPPYTNKGPFPATVDTYFPLDDARAAAGLPPAFRPSSRNDNDVANTTTSPIMYLGAHFKGSPYLPSIACLSHHPRRLIPKGTRDSTPAVMEALAVMLKASGGSGNPLAAPPLDSAIAAAAVPLLTTPRHNTDPLYLLRTVEYHLSVHWTREASCAPSRYATKHPDKGDTFPAHPVSYAIDNPNAVFMSDGCLPQPHAELRNRLVVAAYLRAHTRDGEEKVTNKP